MISFALEFVRSPKKFNVLLCQKVPAPRPENSDSDEKDALFGLHPTSTIFLLLPLFQNVFRIFIFVDKI
jgi:hypothetical protein